MTLWTRPRGYVFFVLEIRAPIQSTEIIITFRGSLAKLCSAISFSLFFRGRGGDEKTFRPRSFLCHPLFLPENEEEEEEEDLVRCERTFHTKRLFKRCREARKRKLAPGEKVKKPIKISSHFLLLPLLLFSSFNL